MKTAINTRTQEEYDALMRWRKENGQLSPESNYFTQYKENTCVLTDDTFLYGSRDFYECLYYTIIPYTEFAKANIVERKQTIFLVHDCDKSCVLSAHLTEEDAQAERTELRKSFAPSVDFQIEKVDIESEGIGYKAKYEEAVKLLEWSKQICSNIQRTKTYGTRFPETATLGNAIDDFLNPR